MRSCRYFALCLLLQLVRILRATDTEPVTYDQRQSGHYNIHISIKDVAIIDLEGNDFADKKPGPEDYYYDDSDFTIKPLGSLLSSKPTTSTTTTPPSTSYSQNITPPVIIQSSATLPPSVHQLTSLNNTNHKDNTTISNPYLAQQFADEVPKPIPTKKPSVVIIDTDVPPRPVKPHHYPSHSGGLIPVQIITDPMLRQQPMAIARHALRARDDGKSSISARTELGVKSGNRSCRRGQIMDSKGNCRTRRSSIIGKLLHVVKALTPSDVS